LTILNEDWGFCIKYYVSESVVFKNLLLVTCINQSFDFVNRLYVLTYLPSLAVWQKDHVMFGMELDVQMEGRFNIWGRFIEVS